MQKRAVMSFSLSLEQSAFAFFLACPHTPYTRWDEVVVAIKDGGPAHDPNSIECWLFNLDSVPYQFTLDEDWIHFHPGADDPWDYVWMIPCPTRIDEIPSAVEIMAAVENDGLGQLLDDVGGVGWAGVNAIDLKEDLEPDELPF